MQLFGAVASPQAHGAVHAHALGQSTAVAQAVGLGSTHLLFLHMNPVGPQSAAVMHGNW
jgi:hypothetical protein